MHNAGLGSWPGRRAAMSPGRTALIFEGRRVSYAELHQRIARLAAALRSSGVRRGDRVAYLGPNHPSFVETMFATWALGAVFVPLNFRLTAAELSYQLSHSGAAVLIHAPGSPAVTAPVTFPVDGLPAADPIYPDEPVGLSDVAAILYTSGTTGHPKGAMLTHGNLVWNCYNLLVCVDVASDEVTLVSAPLFHVAALDQCLLPTFLKGGTSVIMPSWDVDGCFDLIERHRVTWMFGVTTMFAGLSQSPRWAGADLSSVRSLMTGGASVPEALIHRYQERGLLFCQGYGMTETAPGATFLEARESREHVGSAGLPVFFADVRCVRPDLTDAGPGEPGEVLVRGPNVTPGYWNDPAASAAAFVDGEWFRSGTWPWSTRPGTSASSTGPRTCTSPAGRTSTRPRWRRPSSNTPGWRKWPWSGCRTGSGERWGGRSSYPGRVALCNRTTCRPFCGNGSPSTRSRFTST
ncbi:hypothetical protein Aiant_13870 [Actinoplanes ianthinogenes]|uniref:AMP-dependent synthetase/ligase domain-containing protein n=1 Tax=Actinoplanes ianthinogenes TaxID=122358 RepID=A0ABM7LNE4_9ACTN|nr:hypothetical protein Aiant_13870 [Actinoplanes ianthinogenes]